MNEAPCVDRIISREPGIIFSMRDFRWCLVHKEEKYRKDQEAY